MVEEKLEGAVVATADLGMAATVRAVLLDGASDVLVAASRLDFLTMAESLAVVARYAGKESTHSFPLSTYSAPGGLRQDPGRAA
jgi:hypothetical protein